MRRLLALLAAGLVSTLLLASTTAASSEPVQISFDKSMVDPAGVWQGTVDGDVSGNLTTNLRDLEVDGTVWKIRFDWIVTGAGNHDFVATADGILSTTTGRVVTNGTVTSGWLAGARFHEEGRLVDAATSRFQGLITLLPASS